MAEAWWDNAPDLLKHAFQQSRGRTGRRFRFGLGILELDCDDEPLSQRFSELYPEGEVREEPGAATLRVRCTVRSLDNPPVAAIRFEDPEALDAYEFCRALFPDRDYVPGPAAPPGWRTISLEGRRQEPMIAMSDADCLADRRQSWQPLVANLALNRLLRLQREVFFFHAGSAGVGACGVLLAGAKGSGKTTLSLALAARGHAFMGDEIAAVHAPDRKLLAFRRAASIRHGIRAERVAERLGAAARVTEVARDGSERVLASVGELFPEARASEPRLRLAFFLRRFAPQPRAEAFEFGREHFALLTPLGSSMWGAPGLRLLQLSRLMTGVRCYHLDPGAPDETASLLERLAKETQH